MLEGRRLMTMVGSAIYCRQNGILTCSLGNVSEAMQNLMMGHASITTFVKHYLSRRVTVDTQAVVRGIQPQDSLMRAACTLSRSIDPRRPRRLTQEQSASINDQTNVRALLEQHWRSLFGFLLDTK